MLSFANPHKYYGFSCIICNLFGNGFCFIIYLQSGYSLFDRVIRPAEVGVTCAAVNQEKEAEA